MYSIHWKEFDVGLGVSEESFELSLSFLSISFPYSVKEHTHMFIKMMWNSRFQHVFIKVLSQLKC